MSRWFRHYAGMMRDDKLVSVAIRSKQSIERVCWIWGAILESASEVNDAGKYVLDAAEAAYFLRADENDILGVENALEVAGRLAGGFVVKWGNRQFQSDRSAERQSRYRQRQKTGDSDGQQSDGSRQRDDGVTSPKRHGDAPETETETEQIDISSNEDTSVSTDAVTVQEFVDGWNAVAERKGLVRVQRMSDQRKANVRARIRQNTFEELGQALAAVERSKFLCGDVETRDGRTWRADFDWFVKAGNFIKLLEGKYDG